jgi:S-adenosylmethionine decarboxylase
MNTLARHLIAEFYGCSFLVLDDVEQVRRSMLDAAEAVQPQGVSGTLLIAESHLSVHTWPEAGYAAVDIFTCGGLDPRPGFHLLEQALGAGQSRVHEIARGLPAELEENRTLLPEDVRLITRLAEW